LVLRWFISSLRNQQYAGRKPEAGVKKPLNAFLGEVFIAKWEDEAGTTRLVSEQVSHHPPVTACRVWNDDHGVYAEGFTRQEITFSGTINIKQIGRATLRLSKHDDETYLIPLPNVKVSGIFTGTPYPELGGTYRIPSTNGYFSTIDFSGKSIFSSSSKKHTFVAKLYKEGEEDRPLYTLSGNWDTEFTIHDVQEDKAIETFNIVKAKSTPITTDPLDAQDPWETRLAWRGVREALEMGDMQGTSDAKSKLESGQRAMRKQDGDDGRSFPRVFFHDAGGDQVATSLAKRIGESINPRDTEGIWLFNLDAWNKGIQKPYHGDLQPDNARSKNSLRETEMNGAAMGGAHKVNEVTSTYADQLQSRTEAVTPNASRSKASGSEQTVDVDDKEVTTLNAGIGGMSVREQGAVEEMIRDRHSSTT
jgi:oxysterol-binding protein-related protein 9/10/11